MDLPDMSAIANQNISSVIGKTRSVDGSGKVHFTDQLVFLAPYLNNKLSTVSNYDNG